MFLKLLLSLWPYISILLWMCCGYTTVKEDKLADIQIISCRECPEPDTGDYF
jgi:hypothetical protein